MRTKISRIASIDRLYARYIFWLKSRHAYIRKTTVLPRKNYSSHVFLEWEKVQAYLKPPATLCNISWLVYTIKYNTSTFCGVCSVRSGIPAQKPLDSLIAWLARVQLNAVFLFSPIQVMSESRIFEQEYHLSRYCVGHLWKWNTQWLALWWHHII